MHDSLIKAGLFALAFGGLALSGQAFALSPVPLDDAGLTIPVVDEETQVEEHLNPAETPPGPQDQAAPQAAAPAQAGKGEGEGGDVEEKELQNMFPSTDWPKK